MKRLSLVCLLALGACARPHFAYTTVPDTDLELDTTAFSMPEPDPKALGQYDYDTDPLPAPEVAAMTADPAPKLGSRAPAAYAPPPQPSRQQGGPQPPVPDGQLTYRIPDTMTVGKMDTIRVRIARSTQLPAPANLPLIPIQTSAAMEVKLLDPSHAFLVEESTSTQAVDDSEWTEWIFYVTPQKSGTYTLTLIVSRIVEGNKKERSYTGAVRVRSNPVLAATSFWDKEWKWLLGLCLPALWVLLKKRFKILRKLDATQD